MGCICASSFVGTTAEGSLCVWMLGAAVQRKVINGVAVVWGMGGKSIPPKCSTGSPPAASAAPFL